MKKCKTILYHIYEGTAYSFNTMMDATKYLGKNNSGNVATAAQGGGVQRYITIGNYLVFYEDDFTLDTLIKRLEMLKGSTRKTPIIAHDLMDDSEQVFKSIREASETLHLDRRAISRSIIKNDELKGYLFRKQFNIVIPDKLPKVIEQ